eukprot:964708_1
MTAIRMTVIRMIIRKGKGNRLRNRTRLNDVIFGMEHTTAELLRIYKYRLSSTHGQIGLFRKMAQEYKRRYPSKQQSIIGNPLRSKYNISKRMDGSTEKPNVFQMNIPSDL